MQLLLELGAKIQLPAGISLQQAIRSKSRDIVKESRDRTVFDQYCILTEFAIDEALRLSLIDKHRADLYKREYCH